MEYIILFRGVDIVIMEGGDKSLKLGIFYMHLYREFFQAEIVLYISLFQNLLDFASI